MATYPIVLAHGIARFDVITEGFLKRFKDTVWGTTLTTNRLHYFKGIVNHLHNHGIIAFTTHVGFADDVEVRARQLAHQINEILATTQAQKVHIIGHSMGGLDGRHMIIHENMADKVASLTTIGTPHLGTSFADFGLTHGGDKAIEVLRPLLPLDGFLTLTHAERAAFNTAVEDSEANNPVYYQTYGSTQQKDKIFIPLRGSWQIIHDAEGANDGLVPLTSQLWTTKLIGKNGVKKTVHQHHYPFPADHLNQVGWWNLDELNGGQWWKTNLLRQKREFETAVRQLFLTIARDVIQHAD